MLVLLCLGVCSVIFISIKVAFLDMERSLLQQQVITAEIAVSFIFPLLEGIGVVLYGIVVQYHSAVPSFLERQPLLRNEKHVIVGLIPDEEESDSNEEREWVMNPYTDLI